MTVTPYGPRAPPPHSQGSPHHQSPVGVVPEPPPRGGGELVPQEHVLVEVEDGELPLGHDIAVGLGQHPVPDLRQRQLEDPADVGVLRAVRAVPRHLEGRGHLAGVQGLVGPRRCWGLCRGVR